MTEKISLNLTLEELEIIDKYIELNDDTRQLFDKIQKAYPIEKQSKTLTDIVYRWWDDAFTFHIDWDKEICVEDLIDQVEQFLPKPQSAADYQSLTAANMVEGWNNCLKKIKSKLR